MLRHVRRLGVVAIWLGAIGQAGSGAFASTLTVSYQTHENFAPSRFARLAFDDGSNLLSVDLSRTNAFGLLGQIVEYDGDGDLAATFTLPPYSSISYLSLGGIVIPSQDYGGYQVTFAILADPMNPPGGSASKNYALDIAVVQLSTGLCVFCATAPHATGSGSKYTVDFPIDIRSSFTASGEIVPEPASWQLLSLGLIVAGLGPRSWRVAIARRKRPPCVGGR